MPRHTQEERSEWIPKTRLGQDVVKGKYTSIDDILAAGEIILEPEIVDYLVPDIMQEIIYIGGSPGKGGGIRRTVTKRTARMHKSGRRFKLTALVVVGNEKNLLGMGKASLKENRAALEKATAKAKRNLIRVRKYCGSWECGCGTDHSIPFATEGKSGSVRVILKPAPKGVGIVASKEVKKILRLAGIKDIWVQSFGNTGARMNVTLAVFEALRKLSQTKGYL